MRLADLIPQFAGLSAAVANKDVQRVENKILMLNVGSAGSGVAAGSALSSNDQTADPTAYFVCDEIRGGVFAAAAVASALAGTPLPDNPDPAGANNTLPSAWLVTGNLLRSNTAWASADLPMPMLLGSARAPSPMLTKWVLGPNERVRLNITNGTNAAATTASVYVVFGMMGRLVYVN